MKNKIYIEPSRIDFNKKIGIHELLGAENRVKYTLGLQWFYPGDEPLTILKDEKISPKMYEVFLASDEEDFVMKFKPNTHIYYHPATDTVGTEKYFQTTPNEETIPIKVFSRACMTPKEYHKSLSNQSRNYPKCVLDVFEVGRKHFKDFPALVGVEKDSNKNVRYYIYETAIGPDGETVRAIKLYLRNYGHIPKNKVSDVFKKFGGPAMVYYRYSTTKNAEVIVTVDIDPLWCPANEHALKTFLNTFKLTRNPCTREGDFVTATIRTLVPEASISKYDGHDKDKEKHVYCGSDPYIPSKPFPGIIECTIYPNAEVDCPVEDFAVWFNSFDTRNYESLDIEKTRELLRTGRLSIIPKEMDMWALWVSDNLRTLGTTVSPIGIDLTKTIRFENSPENRFFRNFQQRAIDSEWIDYDDAEIELLCAAIPTLTTLPPSLENCVTSRIVCTASLTTNDKRIPTLAAIISTLYSNGAITFSHRSKRYGEILIRPIDKERFVNLLNGDQLDLIGYVFNYYDKQVIAGVDAELDPHTGEFVFRGFEYMERFTWVNKIKYISETLEYKIVEFRQPHGIWEP